MRRAQERRSVGEGVALAEGWVWKHPENFRPRSQSGNVRSTASGPRTGRCAGRVRNLGQVRRRGRRERQTSGGASAPTGSRPLRIAADQRPSSSALQLLAPNHPGASAAPRNPRAPRPLPAGRTRAERTCQLLKAEPGLRSECGSPEWGCWHRRRALMVPPPNLLDQRCRFTVTVKRADRFRLLPSAFMTEKPVIRKPSNAPARPRPG